MKQAPTKWRPAVPCWRPRRGDSIGNPGGTDGPCFRWSRAWSQQVPDLLDKPGHPLLVPPQCRLTPVGLGTRLRGRRSSSRMSRDRRTTGSRPMPLAASCLRTRTGPATGQPGGSPLGSWTAGASVRRLVPQTPRAARRRPEAGRRGSGSRLPPQLQLRPRPQTPVVCQGEPRTTTPHR